MTPRDAVIAWLLQGALAISLFAAVCVALRLSAPSRQLIYSALATSLLIALLGRIWTTIGQAA